MTNEIKEVLDDLKSFSKNFISGVNIKSNVQKKNNTPAVVIKKEEIKELTEEGKFQEIPLFKGTMEQLDNLTILKEEGKE